MLIVCNMKNGYNNIGKTILILSDQCDIHDSLASLRVQLKAKETPGLGCGLQVVFAVSCIFERFEFGNSNFLENGNASHLKKC